MDFDLAIVGGGPVGLFLALAARAAGLRPVVLEARAPGATQADDRSLALSWASCLRLERVGAHLPEVESGGAIRAIHVSHAGHAGRSWITASDAGIPMLGRVLGYGELVHALSAAARDTVDVRHEHAVSALAPDDDGVRVVTAVGEVRARVAIVADGSGALLAESGFATKTKDYGVHALVARVTADGPARDVAYERFASHGPLALLPRGDGFAIVWTLPEEAARELSVVPDAAFLRALQDAFGWRAGRFSTVAARACYPLVLRETTPLVRGRIAVIGNAAQTLHPVAGQGFNLGLRDAWAVTSALRAGSVDDPLATYTATRKRDRAAVVGFTDTLAGLFRSDAPGVGSLRALGLEALDLLPGARRLFARALAVDAGR